MLKQNSFASCHKAITEICTFITETDFQCLPTKRTVGTTTNKKLSALCRPSCIGYHEDNKGSFCFPVKAGKN